MAHLHSVVDMDKHFVIDAETREITNQSNKITLMQHDHNSERFTFELPREVDGHDMSLCNLVQVHYLNIDSSATRATNAGIYEVEDFKISPDDENVVIGSWLISANATKYPGNLNFIFRFLCLAEDGSTIDYAWNTAPYTGISVGKSINNTEAIAEEYADILAQWKQDFIEDGVTDEQLANAVSAYMEQHPITPPTVSDETIRQVVLQSTVHEVTDSNANAIVPNSPVSSKAVAEELKDFTDSNLFNKLLARLGLTLEDLKESLPKVYITGDITGISAENYVDVMCQYVNAYNQTEFTDYATIAWQGSSSLNFPVKNYKIKLFTDEEREEKSKRTFKDWHATNNYHLKANFGDCTNFMNNMMMHYLTKSYQYLEPLPRENARYTVDGFPILLYVNDDFAGIYFWNLKQDDKIYNLNEEKVDESGNVIQEADLCYQAGRADNYNNAGNNSCAFVYGALNANGLSFADAHAEIDHYWEDRVWDKVSNHPNVLYDTIQWVSEATDEEFKANLSKYFNVDYLINYFVCIYTCGMIDSKAKNFNMLYFPEKGVWYPTFWDMDKAFGSGFNTGTVPYTIEFTPKTSAVYEFDAPANRLFDKLIANFWEECCAKYEELRQTLFTVAQVEDSVNAVWGLATAEMIAENKAVKYDGTSYTGFKTDGASFVVDWAEQRFAFMDSIFSSVYAKGYIDASGNIVEADSAYYTVDYTAVTPETTITVKAEQQFDSWRVALYDENKNFVRRVVATNATTKVYETDTITLNSNEKYLRFSANVSDFSAVSVVFNSMQVMEQKYITDYYIDATGNIIQQGGSFYIVDYVDVTPETTITVKAEQQFNSWRVALYDENKNFVRRVVATNATTKVYETDTITLNSNEKYLRFSAGGCDDISKLVSSFEVVTHNE